MERLIEVIQELSLAKELPTIIDIVRREARVLTGADGATFVLREGDKVFYVDEDAIGPLWKGKRFPMRSCISGWAIENKQHVAIEDIYKDLRIPTDAYRPTFVKSLLMMPIRRKDPIGSIGVYWSSNHLATPEQISLLQALADSVSIAIENIQLVKDLKHQVALREEFISNAVHELKTPITPIQMQLLFLRRIIEKGELAGNPRESDLVNLAQLVSRQFTNMTQIVDNMLDVTRLRMGQFALAPAEIDLEQVMQKILEQFKGDVHAHSLSVRFESQVKGYWDPIRLEQAIRNLITNAIHYGEGKPVIVDVKEEEGQAVISVEDHGIGIAREDQERIFGQFERATSYRNYGGLGLGLYIVKSVAQAHGGHVEVESVPGEGSRFTMRVPLKFESTLRKSASA